MPSAHLAMHGRRSMIGCARGDRCHSAIDRTQLCGPVNGSEAREGGLRLKTWVAPRGSRSVTGAQVRSSASIGVGAANDSWGVEKRCRIDDFLLELGESASMSGGGDILPSSPAPSARLDVRVECRSTRRKSSDKKPPQDLEGGAVIERPRGVLCGGERFEFSHLHRPTFGPLTLCVPLAWAIAMEDRAGACPSLSVDSSSTDARER